MYCSNTDADVDLNSGTSVPIEVKESRWRCPDCTPNEQYVLEQLQEKLKLETEMHLQRYWETLNRKATSIPTYAREGLEFLTGIALGVGMAYSVDQHKSLP